MNNMPQDPTELKAAIENLFIANPALDSIGAHLNRFNPIRVMKMAHMEIRHSAILGWLLDPQETHGLGDKVLKSFLANALRTGTGESAPNISALDILQGDLRDAEVRIEWQNIDLLVICPTNKWVFVIENKFHSKQGETQLEDYANDIEKRYPDFRLQGVFLTLHGEKAKDRNRYRDTTYAQLLKCIHGVLLTERASLTTEVAMFIDHYIDVLKGATGMDDELNALKVLARNLYRDHKKALDFIMEHGTSNSIHQGIADAFGSDPVVTPDAPQSHKVGTRSFTLFLLGTRGIGFLPTGWIEAFGEHKKPWPGCERYWAELPLTIFVRWTPDSDGIAGKININAEVGPIAPYNARVALINHIKAAATAHNESAAKNQNVKFAFTKNATLETAKYSRFFDSRKINAPVKDVDDYEAVSEVFTTLLKKFETEFDLVERAIKDWVVELSNIA